MPDPSEVAAEDQALAAARHAADCTLRFWQVLTDGGIPPDVAAALTASWLDWWLEDRDDDLDDDEFEDV